MKRQFNLISKILCAFTFLAYIGCNEQTSEKPKDPVQEDKKTVKPPNEIIDISEAKSMYESYEKRRVPLIQQYEDSINTEKGIKKEFDVGRFVYYDYKTIKQYLAYIEQEAADANVEISTLRLYYSNYPDEEVFPNSETPIKHPRQNSLMLSPTYNDGKRDFLFYTSQGAEGKQAVPMNNSFEDMDGYGNIKERNIKAYASFVPNLNNVNVAPAVLQGKESLTLNRGTGVPPPKNQ